MGNELWWNTLFEVFALVRIDKSPDGVKEVIVSPIIRQAINTLIHKQVTFRFIEPNEWFHFCCPATRGVKIQTLLPLPYKLEYYADEAIRKTH